MWDRKRPKKLKIQACDSQLIFWRERGSASGEFIDFAQWNPQQQKHKLASTSQILLVI